MRSAEAHDVPAVLAFWQVAAENAQRPVDTPAGVAALHRHDPDALVLAVDDSAIVGTIIAGWDGWRCHLYRLAVDPSRRRAGVGRALIAAAEDRFRALGGVRVDAVERAERPVDRDHDALGVEYDDALGACLEDGAREGRSERIDAQGCG